MTVQRISSEGLRDVLLVSGVAQEINDVHEQLTRVLSLLERIFKTGNNNFYFAGKSGQSLNLGRMVSRGIEEKFFLEFKEYYHKLDPFYRILATTSPPTVVVRDHSRNRGRLAEYYSDFLKPQSIHHQMSIYLKKRDRFLGVIGLYRPENAAEFSSMDRAKAGMMAPYLAGALENAINSEEKAMQEAVIDSIAGSIPYKGIVVLDQSLEIIYQNGEAARFFSSRRGLKNERKLASSPLPDEIYSRLREFLWSGREAQESEPGQKHLEFSCKMGGGELPVHLRLIEYRDNKTLLLLCFCSEAGEPALSERLRQYGLSKRQVEVVLLLSKGLTNKEIGKRLFISRYTVENHLKAIYEKINVKNRTELSYRIQQASTD